jgi:hypothetical protein
MQGRILDAMELSVRAKLRLKNRRRFNAILQRKRAIIFIAV